MRLFDLPRASGRIRQTPSGELAFHRWDRKMPLDPPAARSSETIPPLAGFMSEREPQSQVDLAGVAVVDLVRPVEHRMSGDEVVARAVRGYRTHAAERHRRELRVVERVEECRPEWMRRSDHRQCRQGVRPKSGHRQRSARSEEARPLSLSRRADLSVTSYVHPIQISESLRSPDRERR